jgi:hypothetical protein
MKFNSMLFIGLAALLFAAKSSFGQTTTPPDGDGTELTVIQSVPGPTEAPPLTSSLRVIVAGGAPVSPAPVAVVPPTIATNAPTLVCVSPTDVGPVGTNSPALMQAPSPAVVIIRKTQPTFGPGFVPPTFGPAFAPSNRFIIARPGPPMLKPIRQ